MFITFSLLLDVFIKQLQKVTVGFLMSIIPFLSLVFMWKNLASMGWIFMNFNGADFLLKSVTKIQVFF